MPQCYAQNAQQFVTVRTTLGDVRGRVSLVLNRNVNQFLGVPYAEPPLAERRFQKPVPVRAWTNTLDATQFGSSCPQPGRLWQRTSEDCLFLNIYITAANDSLGRQQQQQQQKPVMVWIHGGGFEVGAGSDAEGSAMAVRGEVVVVTLNYRLGLLGWLSAQDRTCPGNNGLWDQRLALMWVRDHIASFGGDPSQITIFGESGGGYSVGLHTLSPLNNGLFRRAIMQSGTALNRRTIALDPVGFAQRFARNLGCWRQTKSGFDTQFLINCARSRPVNDILRATQQAKIRSTVAWILDVAPVIDGELIPVDSETLMGPRYYDHVPFWKIDIMVGTNSAEGNLLLGPLRSFQGALRFRLASGIPTQVLRNNITTALARDYFRGSRDISDAMYTEYRTQLGDAEQGRQVVNLYGDMMFVSPAVETLQRHVSLVGSQHSHYQYLFSYTRTGSTPFPWFRGAGHGVEVGFLFGVSAGNYQEARLSIAMMDGWANFAKYGTPNNQARQPGTFQWPAYDLTTKAYTNLDLVLTSERDLYSKRMQFWLQTIPRLPQGGARPLTSVPQVVGRTTFRPAVGGFEGFLVQPTSGYGTPKPQSGYWANYSNTTSDGYLVNGTATNGGTRLKFSGPFCVLKFGFFFLSFLVGMFLM
ncbi:hypothetical protein ACOMHN_035925 [Nucella lapillus]